MNTTLEHVIHMFIVGFMQEDYHSGDVAFRYLTLGDEEMDKCIYK